MERQKTSERLIAEKENVAIELQNARNLAKEKAKAISSEKEDIQRRLALARQQKRDVKEANKRLKRGFKIQRNLKAEESFKLLIASKRDLVEKLKAERAQLRELVKQLKERAKELSAEIRLAKKDEKASLENFKFVQKCKKEQEQNKSSGWVTVKAPEVIETQTPEEKLVEFFSRPENHVDATKDEIGMVLFCLEARKQDYGRVASGDQKDILEDFATYLATNKELNSSDIPAIALKVFTILVQSKLLALGTMIGCTTTYYFNHEEAGRILRKKA